MFQLKSEQAILRKWYNMSRLLCGFKSNATTLSLRHHCMFLTKAGHPDATNLKWNYSLANPDAMDSIMLGLELGLGRVLGLELGRQDVPGLKNTGVSFLASGCRGPVFDTLSKCQKLPSQVRKSEIPIIQRNAFGAHHESILAAMVSSTNLNHIMSLRGREYFAAESKAFLMGESDNCESLSLISMQIVTLISLTGLIQLFQSHLLLML